jgi:hypothetical protein
MRSLLTVVVSLVIAAGGFAVAGFLSAPINQDRKEKNLAISDEVYDLPPEMAVTQAALGTFRGVAINVLWQRVETLKNEGKYHEAIELGKLITRLQPKFPRVWEFVAWNQAYNISVGTHTPAERWHWVKSGIDVLQTRGGGLDNNPQNVRLYQQLAWIYHHKLGMFQDNFNWHYKRELSRDWHTILGDHPRKIEPYIAWFEPIAKAPADANDLPQGARDLASWLAAEGYELGPRALRDFTVETEIVNVPVPGQTLPDGEPVMRQQTQTLRTWPDFASRQDIDQLVAFIRKSIITDDEHNMDPALMLEDVRAMGPLDWRHPASHAIYWVRRGMEVAEQDEGRSDDGLVNARRQIFNSLEQLAQQGRVVFEPTSDYVSYVPEWSFWLRFDDFYDELRAHPDVGPFMDRLYGSGYRSRMDEAIFMAELYGDRETAQQLLDRMATKAQGTRGDDHYDLTLEDFVAREATDILEDPAGARSAILTLLTQAQVAFFLQNDAERADRLASRSKDIHDQYRQTHPNPADPLYHEMPDFDMLQMGAIGGLLTGQSARPTKLGVAEVPMERRAQLWAALPESAREFIFLNFGEAMFRQATMAGFEPQSVFPPPLRFRQGQMGITRDDRQRQEQADPDVTRAEQQRSE